MEEEDGQRGFELGGSSQSLGGCQVPGRLPVGCRGPDVRVHIADVFRESAGTGSPMCSVRRCLTLTLLSLPPRGQRNNNSPSPEPPPSDGRRAETPGDGAAMSSPGLQV